MKRWMYIIVCALPLFLYAQNQINSQSHQSEKQELTEQQFTSLNHSIISALKQAMSL